MRMWQESEDGYPQLREWWIVIGRFRTDGRTRRAARDGSVKE